MKNKRILMVLLVALLSVSAPACAQDSAAADEAGEILGALMTPPSLPDMTADLLTDPGQDRRGQGWEKSKALRETADNKKGGAGQLKSMSAGEHRSAVAEFVNGILDVADRQELGGIGEQVREIARQQNASEDKVTPNLERIRTRSKVKNFFFGTDFGKTKEIKKEMQEAQKRLNDLERAKDGIDNQADRVVLEDQINAFRANIDKVMEEVAAEEGKFSLFGWAKKILAA